MPIDFQRYLLIHPLKFLVVGEVFEIDPRRIGVDRRLVVAGAPDQTKALIEE